MRGRASSRARPHHRLEPVDANSRCSEEERTGAKRHAIEFYKQQFAQEIAQRKAHFAIERFERHFAIAREIGGRYEEVRACWNLGLEFEKLGELGRAAAMMQIRVDYLREIGHPDAEKDVARVEALRARMGAPDAAPD